MTSNQAKIQWDKNFRDQGSGCWSVVECLVYSVAHMTHNEIVESILDDLLHCYFNTPDITRGGMKWYEFFRFISKAQQGRVLEALLDERVQELSFEDKDGILRLIPERSSLHKAMSIAGTWYEGYDPPEDVETVCLSEKGQRLIDEMGVENAAGYLVECLAHGIDPDPVGGVH